jgi:CubicO group peptidase (beta-lactamase class C family)
MISECNCQELCKPIDADLCNYRIDNTVSRAMKVFDVPGLAIGIVKNGEVVFVKHYSVREYGKSGSVDPDTLLQTGSNNAFKLISGARALSDQL